jgi:putative peptide modification system cyclase
MVYMMSDRMAANPNTTLRRPPVSAVLRTVLLCDWSDSTQLIETLGDSHAVALLQEHDQFLRNCLSITQGRLIDKADGVLALFERPIQALDFALRYQQQMRVWSKHYQQPIQARIGIHVGDVMTWQNEPDQIKAGAKPLEVEGLAKPIAARLMSLAMPGQILMSGMAQSLAQRAQLELGERGQNLRWLVHGRYQFKGVPAPMLVHEVGDPEFSPLRAPASTQKAWRDIPFWRRPPVVALEVLLSLGLVGGFLYSTFQSPPAIAFYERDWIVLADVQNRSNETMFNGSLDTAMRIGLEQSAYVNVISDTQELEALKRMKREGQRIDRQIGTELALRENAKALVLPTLTQVGGRLRVTAEVIDPNTGVTVYTESADAKNSDSVLPALDTVLEKIRTRLGESISLVDKSSKPLDQVTTSSLEALRAYSLAAEAKRESRFSDAKLLYQQAIKHDSNFALAYNGLASISYIASDDEEFEENIALAKKNRQHLTDRESLFLDATASLLKNPNESLQYWKLLGKMYPDEYRAHYNYLYFSYLDGNVDAEALNIIELALKTHNSAIGNAYYLKGASLLFQNKYREALDAFAKAEASGVKGYKSDQVMANVAIDDYDNAKKVLASQTSSGDATTDLANRLPEILVPLSQGDFDLAIKISKDVAGDESRNINTKSPLHGSYLSLQSFKPHSNFDSELSEYLNKQIKLLQAAQSYEKNDLQFNILTSSWMAARTGNIRLAEIALEKVKMNSYEITSSVNSDMQLVAQAEIFLSKNMPLKAISILEKQSRNKNSLYLLQATIEHAYRVAGKKLEADVKLQWLSENRGRAYAEYNRNYFLQPVNVYTYYLVTSRQNMKGPKTLN